MKQLFKNFQISLEWHCNSLLKNKLSHTDPGCIHGSGDSQLDPGSQFEAFTTSLYVDSWASLHVNTALRNYNRIVLEAMSSWIALTMHLGMKATFQTKYIQSKYVRNFILVIFNFHIIIRIWIGTETQFDEFLVVECCICIWYKMLSSSLYSMIKKSKTISI